MAVQYRRNLTIPDGFPGILKAFTRETLRSQPEDLYAFAAEYFSQQLQLAREQGLPDDPSRRGSLQAVGTAGTSLSSLYDQLFNSFQQQAAKGSGLTAPEAREILRKIWAIYSLPQISADAATALAQLDANGCVDVPNLTNSSSQVLHELISKSFAPMREAATAAYLASPLAKLVCNVAPDDLQAILQASLDAACGNTGSLTSIQAQSAIAELAAGSLELSLRDSNALTAALMPSPAKRSQSYDQSTLQYLVQLLKESQKEAFIRQYLQANEHFA